MKNKFVCLKAFALKLFVYTGDISGFDKQHGIFGAVLLLVLSAAPMPVLQYVVVTLDLVTDVQLQWLGVFLIVIGMLLGLVGASFQVRPQFTVILIVYDKGGISLQWRQLWLYYIGIN